MLRTDFSSDAAWEALGGLPAAYEHPLLVLADEQALGSAEFPLLVVDLREERGRCLRVVASELWVIGNNLWVANMDFREFAEVDADGVHRGFWLPGRATAWTGNSSAGRRRSVVRQRHSRYARCGGTQVRSGGC